MHVMGKTWADDATVAELVRALADVLDPQATLCPGGKQRRNTPERLREMARQAAASRPPP